MNYDFTSIIDRSGKDSIAVDRIPVKDACVQDSFDRIPMWVADMNFPTCPSVTEAIIDRARHPAFGYFEYTDAYYDAIIRWQAHRNGVTGLKKEHISYQNGVLGGVVSALKALASRGDNILVHSPTYIGFTHCMEDNGFHIVLSPLKKDAAGIWRMDLADMEKKITEHHIHAAIFCSPHNPCGRVWERREIEEAMDLYRRHDVFVISDEIWSDLIRPGHHHIPTQSISEDARSRTIALYAPSKTFNLAGLIGSYQIAYNPWLIDRTAKEAALSHYNNMNVLSMHALTGAYTASGEEWLDELCQVLAGNVDYACDFIDQHFDGVTVTRPEGTYMLFLDCTDWCAAHQKTLDELLRAGVSVGVIWQDGRPFHGPCHIRMNLALPLSRVKEAFDRLNRYVFHV